MSKENMKTCPDCMGKKKVPALMSFNGLLSGPVPSNRLIDCPTCDGKGAVPAEIKKES